MFFPKFISKNMFFSKLIILSNTRQLIENYICEKQVSRNEMWLPPTKVIIWVHWWTDTPLLHGEDGFCVLVKHMLKTYVQKHEISCIKDLISVHMQTLALKCSQKNEGKKIIALVWKLTYTRQGFLNSLKGGGLFDPRQ